MSRIDTDPASPTSTTAVDTTDGGCQGCTIATTSTLTRNVSMTSSSPSSSSQDNDISLNIKKTNFVHKGDQRRCHFIISFEFEWLNRFYFDFPFLNTHQRTIGMMDIALLTANANQLRFLLTYNTEEKTFYVSVTLLVLSLIVQVAVGLGLVYKVGLPLILSTFSYVE